MFRTTAALLVAALLAACASAPRDTGGTPAAEPQYGDEWAATPGAASMAELRLAPEIADLALTVYPTPRRAEYGSVLLPLDGAEVVDEAHADSDAILREAGLEIGFRELPPEGYALAVVRQGGRTVVLAAARDDAGRRWAAQALGQVTTTSGGRRMVRACRVLDAPVFPLRGNKRPQEWEARYRANFAWEVKDAPEYEGLHAVATFAPGSPVDATPEAAARILELWRPWQERGVRRFCLKFDDVGFEMTVATELRFGSYAAAVRGLLSTLRGGLRERDPGAVLYFLPQTYWWDDPRLGTYARAIRAAGGLETDIGLVLTGPRIISRQIDAPGLAAARELFGSRETPALLYDNLGREGDWGPLTGREPDLSTMADGVFGERGTPVHRLTRLDWLWNPAAYDPETSWRRAILELAGPGGFAALRDACAAFRAGKAREDAARLVERFAKGPSHDGPVPPAALAALLRGDLRLLPDAAAAAAPSARP